MSVQRCSPTIARDSHRWCSFEHRGIFSWDHSNLRCTGKSFLLLHFYLLFFERPTRFERAYQELILLPACPIKLRTRLGKVESGWWQFAGKQVVILCSTEHKPVSLDTFCAWLFRVQRDRVTISHSPIKHYIQMHGWAPCMSQLKRARFSDRCIWMRLFVSFGSTRSQLSADNLDRVSPSTCNFAFIPEYQTK